MATSTTQGHATAAVAPPAEKAPVALLFEDEHTNDPSYLKTYFNKLDTLLTPALENPTRLFHDLEVHLRTAMEDTTTIFAETLLQGNLVRLVQTTLERKYPWSSWCEAAVNFLTLVVQSITKLIEQRNHPEETLRALEKIFFRRAIFYQHHGWNDATDELRPKFFPSAQADQPDDAPELYAQVQPQDSTPSYWYLEMIMTFGPAFEVILARINDAEHQLDANRMYQMLKAFELIRGDLKKSFLTQFVPRLADAVLGNIRRFNDGDLRSQSLDDLLDSLNVVSKLAGRVRMLVLAEQIEFFKLELAVRCIQLPYLEARLKGIDQIKHIIQVSKGEAQHHTRARPRRQATNAQYGNSYGAGGWPTYRGAGASSSSSSSSKGYKSQGSDEDSEEDGNTTRFSDGDVSLPSAALEGTPVVLFPAEDYPFGPFDSSVSIVGGGETPEQVDLDLAHDAAEAAAGDGGDAAPASEDNDASSSATSQTPRNDAEESPVAGTTTTGEPTESASAEAPTAGSSSSSSSEVRVSVPEGQPPPPAGLPPNRSAENSAPPPLPPKPKKRKGLAKVITPQFVLNWIKENKILEIILNLEHEEALKQSLSVVLFIAEQEGGLEEPTLQAVWNVAKVHESHARVVYKHLAELLEHLPSAQIDWIYAQINELSPEDYNPQVLTFIGDFTREAIRIRKKRGEELKLYGLEIFWQTLLKASKIRHSENTSAIITETIEHLEKLLTSYPDQRDIFLQRCIDNLNNGEMVSISLKLIRNILGAHKGNELNKMIVTLNERSHLLDSLLKDFYRRASQYASTRASLLQSATADQKSKPLEGRLSMLEFLLTNSGLSLSQEQIFTLWDSLVPLPANDRDSVLEWLETAAFGYLVKDPFISGEQSGKANKLPILEPDTCAALFAERICTFPKALFSMAVLKLFRRFLLSVGLRNKVLHRTDENEILVKDFDFPGLDQLWEIGMDATDSKVASSALSLLRQFYFAGVPGKKSVAVQKRTDFVRRAAEKLFAAFEAAQAGDKHARVQAERCIAILTAVSEQEALGRHPSEIHAKAIKVMRSKQVKLEDVKLPAGALGPAPTQIPVAAPAEGVAESPEAKQARLDSEAKRLAELQEYQDNERRLKLEQIEQMKQRRAEINAEKLAKLRERQSLQREHNVVMPIDWLSEHCLERLLSMLSDQDLRDQLWHLIQALPTPNHILQEVETLEADNGQLKFVQRLGSPDSPQYVFTLLYVLEVIHICIQRAEWRKQLIEAGNFSFFVNLFTQQNIITESSGEYGRSAMTYIVDSMRELFASKDDTANQISIDEGFVFRLMSQISSLASQPRDDKKEEADKFKPTLDLSLLPTIPANKGNGTRFATTWYYSDKDDPNAKTLTFELLPKDKPFRFTAAVYCVDYNTKRRHQAITCFLGDDKTVVPTDLEANVHKCELSSHISDEFHEGIWVVWDCYGAGPLNFQMKSIDGPNWIFPCVLIGPPPADKPDSPAPTPSALPTFHQDLTTRGNWRGKYGQWGGVFLGRVDHRLPVLPSLLNDEVPRIGKFECPAGVLRYEWAGGKFTRDIRALQLIPTEEELLLDGDLQIVEDPLEKLLYPEELKPPRPDYRDPIEDDRIRQLPAPSSPAPPPPPPSIQPIDEEEEPLPQTSTALLELLQTSVSDQPEKLAAVLAFPDLNNWLFDILCKTPDESIRQGLVETISLMDKGAQPPHSGAFLQVLLGFLPTIGGLRGSVASFTQYFSLLQKLLDNAASSGLAVTYDKRALLNQLVVQLRDQPIVERDDSKDPDTALIGILDLIRTVIDGDESLQQIATGEYNLLAEIFGTCLFECPADRFAPQTPKCKLEVTRAAAFRLLQALTKKASSNLLSILGKLSEFLDSAPTPADFSIDLSSKEQAHSAGRGRYVGLRNQGCTCYMNATIQQLFIIPSLRRAILNVDMKANADLQPVSEAASSSAAGPESNIMSALQTLFAFMQESKTAFVDPIQFCKQVRLNGAPIVMTRQEDALEFLNSLSDQVEPYVKGLPQEHMLRDSFGGRFIHQIISHDCEHQSEREEPYLAISVKVQNKRNLKESLESFVQGDMLDGNSKYRCEQCGEGKYVVAKMRCCVEHLPNTLIVHLKRFEFCFDTFENIKVHDHFEFPHELNMRPYTKEGLASAEMKEVAEGTIRPDDYYQYQLTGIIVHNGSATSGHYYSYIKERTPPDDQSAKWFEFNDTYVTPFDPDTIPEHCFGGKYADYRGTKTASAYMLFYERKNYYAPNAYGPSLGPIAEVGREEVAGKTDKEVEPEILDKIFTEGVVSMKKRQIMSRPTLDFIWDVVASLDTTKFQPVLEYRDVTPEEVSDSPVVRIIQLATRYLFSFIAHCNDTHQLKAKAEHLYKLYALHLPSAKVLLERFCVADSDTGNKTLRDAIFVAPDDEIRLPFAEFIAKLIRLLAPYEQAFYDEKIEVVDSKAEPPATKAVPKAITLRFIDTIISMLVASSDRPPARLNPFLYILHQFGQVSPLERVTLLRRNAIADMLVLYEKSKQILTGAWSPKAPLLPLFELLADLVTSCDNPLNLNAQPTGYALEDGVLAQLFDKNRILSISRECGYIPPMRRIWKHWCVGHPDLYVSVVSMAGSGCDTTNDLQHRKQYFEVIKDILGIEDAFQAARTNHIMVDIIRYLTSNLRMEVYRTPFLIFIFEAQALFPLVRQWLVEHDDLNHLYKSSRDLANWVDFHQVEAYVTLVSERDAFLAAQAAAANPDPIQSGAFHSSSEGEDEDGPSDDAVMVNTDAPTEDD